MNQELFRRVHNVTASLPGSLFMDSWEEGSQSQCGTTRCLAGWAVHLTTGQPLYTPDGELHPSVFELAARLGVIHDFELLGAKLLGLSPEVAANAFYISTESAAEYIRLMAEGNEEAALRFLREESVE